MCAQTDRPTRDEKRKWRGLKYEREREREREKVRKSMSLESSRQDKKREERRTIYVVVAGRGQGRRSEVPKGVGRRERIF